MTIERPHYELRPVYDDGTVGDAEVGPISNLPCDAVTSRRGFLNASTAITAMAGTALTPHQAEAASTRRVKAHRRLVSDIKFSPDSSFLVSASIDRTAKIWDFSGTAKTISHDSAVRSVSISPSGTRIASGGSDKIIKLFAPETGEVVQELESHTGTISSVEFLSDDRLASGAHDKTVRIWNVETGNEEYTFDQKSTVYALARIPKSEKFVAACGNKSVGLWDNGQLVASLKGHRGPVIDVKANPDGRGFITRSGDTTMGIWSIPKRRLIRRLRAPWNRVQAMAIGTDGKSLATAKSKTITVWSMPSGKQRFELKEHNARITCLTFSHDGMKLASGDSSGVILLWDAKTGRLEGGLFDAEVNPTGNDGVSFKYSVGGRIVTYTLPCGSPIPPSATCICNCVPGTLSLVPKYLPRNRVRTRRTPRSRSVPVPQSIPYSTCSCNKVCICLAVPICQAHLVTHENDLIRRMAEQLLLAMGKYELVYMKWAAEKSKGSLRRKINQIICRILDGEETDVRMWPSIEQCVLLLDRDERLISTMAAQFLRLHEGETKASLPSDVMFAMDRILTKSEALSWFTKTGPKPESESLQ